MYLTQNEEVRLLGLTTSGARMAITTTASNDTTAGTEVSGGLYARRAVAFNAASSGSITNSDTILFIELPACNAMCWELWSADGTQRRWWGYFSPTAATWSSDVFTAAAHGRVTGSPIVFFGTAPTGLTAGTTYYVREPTTDTFKISATNGGSAVSVAGTGSATFGRVIAIPAGESLQIDAGQLILALS